MMAAGNKSQTGPPESENGHTVVGRDQAVQSSGSDRAVEYADTVRD